MVFGIWFFLFTGSCVELCWNKCKYKKYSTIDVSRVNSFWRFVSNFKSQASKSLSLRVYHD
jgi:hypothetical protein